MMKWKNDALKSSLANIKHELLGDSRRDKRIDLVSKDPLRLCFSISIRFFWRCLQFFVALSLTISIHLEKWNSKRKSIPFRCFPILCELSFFPKTRDRARDTRMASSLDDWGWANATWCENYIRNRQEVIGLIESMGGCSSHVDAPVIICSKSLACLLAC